MTDNDRVTLRDIMKMQQETQDCISALEDKIDKTIGEQVNDNRTAIAVLNTKINIMSMVQTTISIIAGAIAAYLGTRR